MWPEPEEILADLHSGDPARVATALRALRDASDGFDEFPLPYPGLAPLKGMTAPPSELQLDLAHLLSEYGSFEPPVQRRRVAEDLVALTLTHGDDRIAMETSFFLKANPSLISSAIKAMEQNLATAGMGAGAIRLASYLLAGAAPIRAELVAALRRPGLAPLREALRPELEEADEAG